MPLQAHDFICTTLERLAIRKGDEISQRLTALRDAVSYSASQMIPRTLLYEQSLKHFGNHLRDIRICDQHLSDY